MEVIRGARVFMTIENRIIDMYIKFRVFFSVNNVTSALNFECISVPFELSQEFYTLWQNDK